MTVQPKAEWALTTGGAAAAVDALIGFQWPAGQSADTTAWAITLVSALAAVAAAVKTRPFAPAAFAYLIVAGAALMAAHGLHWSPEQVATLASVLTGVLAYQQRGQVAPAGEVKAGRVAPDGVTVLQPPPTTEPS
jgi:hypothetical protein